MTVTLINYKKIDTLNLKVLGAGLNRIVIKSKDADNDLGIVAKVGLISNLAS